MFLKCLILSVLMSAPDILGQQCNLHASDMSKSWVYAVLYDILHTDFIPDQDTLYLICTEDDIIPLRCNQGTLEPRPAGATCASRIRATVDNLYERCSANNMNGYIYAVYYRWPDATTSFLYDVCYSQDDEAVLFARHGAFGFNLAASTYTRPQFTQSGVVSAARVESFKAGTIYNTFVALLGPNQTYVKSAKDFAVQRGHLANSQDFVSYDQMDETFKYVNVMPQFRGSNIGNWKRIENWIHKLPAPTRVANVVTGTHGILELEHSQTGQMVPMYLMANNKNPIPMWTYKVVKYNNVCHAFVTLNNDSNDNAVITTNICQITNCPNGLVFNSDPLSGVSHCCDYAHFVANVGPHVSLC